MSEFFKRLVQLRKEKNINFRDVEHIKDLFLQNKIYKNESLLNEKIANLKKLVDFMKVININS